MNKENYRVCISIDHIKNLDDQPEIFKLSLPAAFRSLDRAKEFCNLLCKLASLIQHPMTNADRMRLR